MAKAVKKIKKKKRGLYQEKIAVNGGFLDIIKAAGKQANNKSAKKPA